MTKLLLVVTGASRGLGKSIAVEFCRDEFDIHAVLMARNKAGLQTTREEMIQARRKAGHVNYHVIDLGDLTSLESRIETVIQELASIVQEENGFDRFVFINNAGSLGPIGPCTDTSSLLDLQRNVDLNVTSALWLSAQMARFAAAQPLITQTTIVNISSLVAIQAFPTMGLYSAGKAARDQYHVAMAKELGSNIQILNYAPGPLETDMTTEIRQAVSLDAELRPHYDKQLIHPIDSAARLVKLVLNGTFESGQHIDYYDLESK